MEYKQPVVDIIRTRQSCRSFERVKIEEEKVEKLNQFIAAINEKAETGIRFLFLNFALADGEKIEKVGTYGVIANAGYYIVGVTDKYNQNMEAFGYHFEKIILFATDLGLGTCLLGGTFNRRNFVQKAGITGNEFIPIVSPVGYPLKKRKAMDKLVRAVAGSDKRKPWEEFFFCERFGNVLLKEKAGDYMLPLEMVRFAPSASNKQPWRIIMNENGFDFYLYRSKGYGKGLLQYDIQRNDIGIAMCHFELTARSMGLFGNWMFLEKSATKGQPEYCNSWVLTQE